MGAFTSGFCCQYIVGRTSQLSGIAADFSGGCDGFCDGFIGPWGTDFATDFVADFLSCLVPKEKK